MDRKKRFILSAGGTGGHLFPAQALAQDLLTQHEILFVAHGLSKNRFFQQMDFPYREIEAATFSSKSPFKLLAAMLKNWRGIRQSLALLKEVQPDAVIGFGSFFTFPLLVAARLKNIPIILHEQNAIPGKVNRLFSRCAALTATTFHDRRSLHGPVVQVKFPLRMSVEQQESLEPWGYFGLTPEKKTLLIFGGSQGAARLNALLPDALHLIKNKEIQVLHFTGKQEELDSVKERYAAFQIQACVKVFETKMLLAWKIADLAITRAGASTLAEIIEFKTPSLLIPFPFAADNHQVKNAEHFVKEVKGGHCLLEEKATPCLIAKHIEILLNNLQGYRDSIHYYNTHEKYPTLTETILTSLSRRPV